MSIPDLVIREIRARPVVAPLPRPIGTASGDVPDAPLLLIDVLTDAGVTGRAYASPIRRSPCVHSRSSCTTSPLSSSENPSARARGCGRWRSVSSWSAGRDSPAWWSALSTWGYGTRSRARWTFPLRCCSVCARVDMLQATLRGNWRAVKAIYAAAGGNCSVGPSASASPLRGVGGG